MKPSPFQHFIFVRPPGSWTWTLHTRAGTQGSVPWRDGRADVANREAQHIAEHTKYCAIVVALALPQQQDEQQYALFADGDTMYCPTKPHLVSARTGDAK